MLMKNMMPITTFMNFAVVFLALTSFSICECSAEPSTIEEEQKWVRLAEIFVLSICICVFSVLFVPKEGKCLLIQFLFQIISRSCTNSDSDSFLIVHVTYDEIYKVLVFLIAIFAAGLCVKRMGMPPLVGEIFIGFLVSGIVQTPNSF